MLASDVRGSRLLADAAAADVAADDDDGVPLLWLLAIELASLLTRRGMLVCKLLSRLRGRNCPWLWWW